ncbi:hypothetical protein BH24ACT15_BH24ACT15_35160 [soil metagenome]
MVQLDLELTDLTATLRRHGVAFALMFGSVAEGRSTDRSDIDLAVWGPTRIDRWSLAAALPTTIDLTLLDEAPDSAGRTGCDDRGCDLGRRLGRAGALAGADTQTLP